MCNPASSSSASSPSSSSINRCVRCMRYYILFFFVFFVSIEINTHRERKREREAVHCHASTKVEKKKKKKKRKNDQLIAKFLFSFFLLPFLKEGEAITIDLIPSLLTKPFIHSSIHLLCIFSFASTCSRQLCVCLCVCVCVWCILLWSLYDGMDRGDEVEDEGAAGMREQPSGVKRWSAHCHSHISLSRFFFFNKWTTTTTTNERERERVRNENRVCDVQTYTYTYYYTHYCIIHSTDTVGYNTLKKQLYRSLR